MACFVIYLLFYLVHDNKIFKLTSICLCQLDRTTLQLAVIRFQFESLYANFKNSARKISILKTYILKESFGIYTLLY